MKQNVAKEGDENGKKPSLLVLDSSYTFETIKRLGLEQSVVVRDLDGFFEHVWSVHPFGDVWNRSAASGPPELHELAPRHSFIQARPGRLRLLERFFPLNFALGQIGLLWRLVPLIRRERISLVRAGDPLYLGLLGLALAKLTSLPLVIRVNGNNEKVRQISGHAVMPRLFRSAAVERLIERYVLPRASWVFAPNQDNLDFAIASGASPQRSSIISFGSLLDPRHFVPPEERDDATPDLAALGVRSGSFLLTIGRLIPPKFPDHVLRVLAILRSRGSDVKAVFAGSGPIEQQLRELATELNVADGIVFAGDQGQGWLWRVIPHAAAVLSPSTGRALSEAALGGAPIIAYDTDWQSELIRSGETGLLVPYRDWRGLAEATWQILSNPVCANRFGQAVRRHAEDLLDPGRAVATEREIYERLVSDC